MLISVLIKIVSDFLVHQRAIRPKITLMLYLSSVLTLCVLYFPLIF